MFVKRGLYAAMAAGFFALGNAQASEESDLTLATAESAPAGTAFTAAVLPADPGA